MDNNTAEPAGARYSGGEPEVEVSDVGQAENWAVQALVQEFMNWLNAKMTYDEQVNKGTADAQALDALQAHLHGQSYADRDEGRRNRDPLLDMRLRQADSLHNDARRQQEQGFQQTQQLAHQAVQTALTHQVNTNAMVSEILANMLEGSRIARDRTWTYSEQVEARTLESLGDTLVEAIRNTPLQPDKNQTVP